MVYTGLLVAVTTLFLALVLTRSPLQMDVLRDRNALYREAGRGLIENVYTLRIINKDTADHEVRLSASGVPGLVLEHDEGTLVVPAASVLSLAARIRRDPDKRARRSVPVEFQMRAVDDPDAVYNTDARFLGPEKR